MEQVKVRTKEVVGDNNVDETSIAAAIMPPSSIKFISNCEGASACACQTRRISHIAIFV
jgi:hypothetical protein